MDHRVAFNNLRPLPSSSNVPSLGRIDPINPILEVSFSFSTPHIESSFFYYKTCIAEHYFGVLLPCCISPNASSSIPSRPDGHARVPVLRVETGVVVFGKAVRNFLAHAPLIDTEMNHRREVVRPAGEQFSNTFIWNRVNRRGMT